MPWTGWLTSPAASEKAEIRDRGVEDRGFRDHAEIDVGGFEPALLGEILERQAGADAIARGERFLRVREDDLRHLALFRSGKLVVALLEQLLGVLVGNLGPFADVLGRNRDKDDLAIFGGAKLNLVIIEIAGQRLRRWRFDRSRLRRFEFDVFDCPLFVLVAAQRLDHRLRWLGAGRNRTRDLTPQRYLALVRDISLLGKAELADHGLETLRVEIAVDALEIGIARDQAPRLVVGFSKAEPARFLVERCFRDGLLQHLAIEAEGAGLLHRQRAAELTADLLQPVGIELAEFIDRDLGVADRGQRRLPEPPEDVGDAPESKTDNQNAHHHGHNGLAEPV